ncbi:hypothetical protein [Paracoccus sp. MC1862]|uniref:hypothetical protein n=1 Tax=Paracoccus sp. MC1862 TaxID=2760307 RepID=UPI001601D76F|nr:hypothetical protein [Paracoccus sp. MC1862]MBB1498671.1 hypothetical protein [Paracoccus sp. MC1862]QQO46180.1 hypothetical protein JGR78_07990 [Paracoccus sp. MC1862]
MGFFRRRRVGTPWGSPQLSDEGREKIRQFVDGWNEGPLRRKALLEILDAELREQERRHMAGGESPSGDRGPEAPAGSPPGG